MATNNIGDSVGKKIVEALKIQEENDSIPEDSIVEIVTLKGNKVVVRKIEVVEEN
jgi:hypothetical protein